MSVALWPPVGGLLAIRRSPLISASPADDEEAALLLLLLANSEAAIHVTVGVGWPEATHETEAPVWLVNSSQAGGSVTNQGPSAISPVSATAKDPAEKISINRDPVKNCLHQLRTGRSYHIKEKNWGNILIKERTAGGRAQPDDIQLPAGWTHNAIINALIM